MIPGIILVSLLSFSSETVKGVQKDFISIKQELSVKLDEAEAKLVELKNKASTNSSAAKEKAIQEAEVTRDQLRVKIDELKDDGKTNWKKLKAGLASSIETMNSKIQKALKD